MAIPVETMPFLTPEQQSPWGNLLSNTLKNYQHSVNARYAPRQKEADIFSKEISPLAALASNPNFTGFNPEVQKMISERVGNYLQGNKGGEGQKFAQTETPPGYASGTSLYDRLSKGADSVLSSGGKGRVIVSNLAAGVKSVAGNTTLGKNISERLGGTKANADNAAFQQTIAEAKHNLKLKGFPDSVLNTLDPMNNEDNVSYKPRVKPLMVAAAGNERYDPNKNYGANERQEPAGEHETPTYETLDRSNKEYVDKTAKEFNTKPEYVLDAFNQGVKTKTELKEWLAWREEHGAK